jgi:hypothetical protein
VTRCATAFVSPIVPPLPSSTRSKPGSGSKPPHQSSSTPNAWARASPGSSMRRSISSVAWTAAGKVVPAWSLPAAERIICTADTMPGHRHDLTRAQTLAITAALNWAAAELNLPTLAGRWRTLRHSMISPRRIGDAVAAALHLTHFEYRHLNESR